MRYLIIVLSILILSSCSMNMQAPCVEDLWNIYQSRYILRENDCCDKAVDYCNVLLAEGYDAHVVVGDVNWAWPPHAWVSVIVDDTEYYVDPVLGLRFKKASVWRDRTAKVMYISEVTPEDVRGYVRILKRYDR